MGVLRRTPDAEERHGFAAGVVLTGIGGIGKTALAGRVISRLRADGWLIAVHEGRWNPTTLIAATAGAITEALPRISGDDAGRPRCGRPWGCWPMPTVTTRRNWRRSPGCSRPAGCYWCSTTSSRTSPPAGRSSSTPPSAMS